MKKRLLKQVFRAFEMMNRCHVGDEGAAGAPAPAEGHSPIQKEVEKPAAEPKQISAPDQRGPVADSSESYFGKKELNPNGYPLNIDTKGMSNEEIDAILADAGGEIIMKDDEYKEYLKNKKGAAEKPKKDEKKEEKGEPKKAPGDKPEEKDDNVLVDQLVTGLGIKVEDLRVLPEKVQEALVEGFVNKTPQENSELVKLKDDYEKLNSNYKALAEDPVFVARAQELATGAKFVADSDAILTNELLAKVDAAFAEENGVQKVRELLKSSVENAIKHQNSVFDGRRKIEEGQEFLNKFLTSLGAIDKRLKTETPDLRKVDISDNAWKTKNKDLSDFIEFCRLKGLSAEVLKKMGPEESYAAFAKSKKWDQAAAQAISEEAKKRILNAIKNPQKIADTLDHGHRSGHPMSGNNSTGFDRQTLLEEMVDGGGSSATYDALLARHDGNERVIATLSQIQDQAFKIIKERSRNKPKTT